MIFREKIRLKSGFSLMELMVVVAVIGVLSAVAIPNIISWLPDYRLRGAARDIVSCLQEAKLRAVKENAQVVVIFDQINETYTCFVDNVPPGGNLIQEPAETIVRTVQMPAGIDIQSIPITSSYTFGFTNRGLSATGAARVQIMNNKGNFMRVFVNLPGNIRVE